jgi:hypothetical protein
VIWRVGRACRPFRRATPAQNRRSDPTVADLKNSGYRGVWALASCRSHQRGSLRTIAGLTHRPGAIFQKILPHANNSSREGALKRSARLSSTTRSERLLHCSGTRDAAVLTRADCLPIRNAALYQDIESSYIHDTSKQPLCDLAACRARTTLASCWPQKSKRKLGGELTLLNAKGRNPCQ